MGYCTWKSFKFKGNTFRIFSQIRNRDYPFFLDSSLNPSSLGRYSFLGSDPFYILKSNSAGVFSELRSVVNKHKVERFKTAPPFLAGAVGFFTYDFGLLLEERLRPLYKSNPQVPGCFFAFYPAVIAIDHFKERLFVVAQDNHHLKKVVSVLAGMNFSKQDLPCGFSKTLEEQAVSNFTKPEYMRAVRKAKNYIRNGDIYQVNLSRRLNAKSNLTAYEIYRRLRKVSPSCFSAYFDCGNYQVISSSPERFLSLRDRLVLTRPMKGTRPRSKDKLKDNHFKNSLLNSAKDKAELMMIVDLERNDLGRACEYSSIKVRSLRNLEKYSTVFQTTAAIEGKLYKDMDAIDLLRASFPGGSITGCPKIRAMEIISELEGTPRDIYTGSLGYLSFCGNMDMNILIRTILKQKQSLSFSVGGGIVADSEPAEEYEETVVKASGMLEAISQ